MSSQPLNPSSSTSQDQPTVHGGTIGMWLFLAALFMLFASSLVGYALIRVNGPSMPALGVVHLPVALWISTAMVLGVSVALIIARRSFEQGRQIAYRKSLIAAAALGAGFITVQIPALVSLILSHRQQLAAGTGGLRLYGLIFFLVLLHALHVIGGMVALVRLTSRTHRGHYDPASPDPIRNMALYWHFLDLVWVAMFALLWTLG